jgi:hypothetical protein
LFKFLYLRFDISNRNKPVLFKDTLGDQPYQTFNKVDPNTSFDFFIKTEGEQAVDNLNQHVYMPIQAAKPNDKQPGLKTPDEQPNYTGLKQSASKMRTIKELTANQDSNQVSTNNKLRPITSMPALITSLDSLSNGILSK